MHEPTFQLPMLGLTLAIPRHYVERAIQEQVEKGCELLEKEPTNQEELDNLKKRHWSWVLETCSVLKDCFGHESVSLYFSSSVFIQASIKLNDLEREIEEFTPTVRGRISRLEGLKTTLPVVPEPPAADLLAALLHPKIAKKSWHYFELGHYVDAITAALDALQEEMQRATSGSIAALGAELADLALHPVNGPLTDHSTLMQHRAGMHQMMTGLFHRYQGMPGYAHVEISEAARVLAIASHMMFLLEAGPKETAEEEVPDESSLGAPE